MSLQNLTIKSQEILQQAQQLAFTAGHSNIETEHILKALLNDKDSPVEFLLKKNNVNINYVDDKLDETVLKLPKVSGGEPAQSLSREANNVLLRANIKKEVVNMAEKLKNPRLLEAEFTVLANDAFHKISSKVRAEIGLPLSERFFPEKEKWLNTQIKKKTI